MNEVEEFLEHYGVPGMKWGVRKQARIDNRKERSDARQARLKSGKGTLKDKLIRDLDIDRPQSDKREPTKADKVVYGAAAAAVVLRFVGPTLVRQIKK